MGSISDAPAMYGSGEVADGGNRRWALGVDQVKVIRSGVRRECLMDSSSRCGSCARTLGGYWDFEWWSCESISAQRSARLMLMRDDSERRTARGQRELRLGGGGCVWKRCNWRAAGSAVSRRARDA